MKIINDLSTRENLIKSLFFLKKYNDGHYKSSKQLNKYFLKNKDEISEDWGGRRLKENEYIIKTHQILQYSKGFKGNVPFVKYYIMDNIGIKEIYRIYFSYEEKEYKTPKGYVYKDQYYSPDYSRTELIWKRKVEGKSFEIIKEKKSEYQGAVGEKITFTANLDDIKEFENQWGFSKMLRFVDKENNIYIWFYSGNKLKFKKGNAYNIKATVKEHNLFGDKKQTIIKRGKIV